MSLIKNTEELNNLLDAVQKLPVKKDEQEKVVDITENGTTEVTPDEGMVLNKVTVNTAIESGGGTEEFVGVKWLEVDSNGSPKVVDITNVPNKTTVLYNGNKTKGAYIGTKKAICNVPLDTIPAGMCTYCVNMTEFDMDFSQVHTFKEGCFDGCENLVLGELPESTKIIEDFAFRNNLQNNCTRIPKAVERINDYAFQNGWRKSSMVVFAGTPNYIKSTAFQGNGNLVDVYVPWAEGAVANAPWGASNATIHYNTTYDENDNPIV